MEDVKDWFRDRWGDVFGDTSDPDRPWAEIYAEEAVELLVEEEHLDHPTEVEVFGIREITDSDAPDSIAEMVFDNDESRRTILISRQQEHGGPARGDRYQAGKAYDIQYSPYEFCGHGEVTIFNRATAALCSYTPFTPTRTRRSMRAPRMTCSGQSGSTRR